MRRRRDDNHNEIGKVFSDLGCSVFDIHTLGGGIGDYIIGLCGLNILVEVKDGSKPPSRRKLTPAEKTLHDTWKGRIEIVESVEDAVKLVNGIRITEI